MTAPNADGPVASFPVGGDDRVDSGFPKYVPPDVAEVHAGSAPSRGRVYINARQFFEPVLPEVWEFHIGGYRVCERYIAERRGRNLSHAEKVQYQCLTAAVLETTRIMNEIDHEIADWPIS